ncbi:MAG: hypothetical protein U0169_25350 [Polyangiaceae bacterium]
MTSRRRTWALGFVLSTASLACGGPPAKGGGEEALSVHSVELGRLRGGWSGTYVFVDPASGQENSWSTIASAKLARADRREKGFVLHVEHPDRPGKGHDLDFSLAESGHVLGGTRVVEKTVVPRGPLHVVTEERGTDDVTGKPAAIKRVLDVDGASLSFATYVKSGTERRFVLRSVYKLAR